MLTASSARRDLGRICLYLFIWAAMPFKWWLVATFFFLPWVLLSYNRVIDLRRISIVFMTSVLLALVYVIGYQNLIIAEDKLLVAAGIAAQAVVFMLVFAPCPRPGHNDSALLLAVAMGFLVHGLVSSLYTFIAAGRSVGLGVLFNPIYGSAELGSPLVSNYLCIAFLVVYFFFKPGLPKYILLLLIIGINLYLVSRAFFVVAVGIVVLDKIINLRAASIVALATTCLVAFALITSSESSSFGGIGEIFRQYTDKGVESTRWEHWGFALRVFHLYPWGGMMVDRSIEDIGSFHNIFFDVYRIAGVAGFFALLALVGASLFWMRSDRPKFLTLFGLVLILSQDVVFEGGQKMLLVFLLLALMAPPRVPADIRAAR
ncbi:hypothetical protein [Noviherbaspirillum sp.]|uniref:hypothetical protein n=1 Tax=Noviherbaspirillum sp. TaxID=1926288 RepID=UPI002FDFACEC